MKKIFGLTKQNRTFKINKLKVLDKYQKLKK